MALGGVPEESVALGIPEALTMVTVAPGLPEEAVANVIENAVKYSPDGESVLVNASTLGDRDEIHVIDRGPGIPHAAKNLIFAPFQRYRPGPAALRTSPSCVTALHPAARVPGAQPCVRRSEPRRARQRSKLRCSKAESRSTAVSTPDAGRRPDPPHTNPCRSSGGVDTQAAPMYPRMGAP